MTKLVCIKRDAWTNARTGEKARHKCPTFGQEVRVLKSERRFSLAAGRRLVYYTLEGFGVHLFAAHAFAPPAQDYDQYRTGEEAGFDFRRLLRVDA